MIIATVLNSAAIIAMAVVVFSELKLNEAERKAAKTEFNQVWDSMYEFTGVNPETVGEPLKCNGEDACEIQFKSK